MNSSESKRTEAVKKRPLRAAALAAGLVLIPAACSDSGDTKTSTPTELTKPAAPATSESLPQQEQAKLAKEAAIRNANALIDILEKSGSGAEKYAGDSVGNKGAVIGPDGVYPSPDDNLAADTFMRLDQSDGKNILVFSSVQEFTDESGKSHFASLQISLNVAEGNPILSQTAQLETEDFRTALEDSDTISFDNMHGSVYQPGLNVNEIDKSFVIDDLSASPAEVIQSLRLADMAAGQLATQRKPN